MHHRISALPVQPSHRIFFAPLATGIEPKKPNNFSSSISIKIKPSNIFGSSVCILSRPAAMCQCKAPDVEDMSDKGSLLGALLQKAIGKFVMNQLDYCGELEVIVAGRNRDLLRGRLPKLQINARRAIYKGISMSNIQLTASAVQFRFRRKRILQQPFRINASVSLREEDLAASLCSPLLSTTISDLLPQELYSDDLSKLAIEFQKGILYLKSQQCNFPSKGHVTSIKIGGGRPLNLPIALAFDVKDGGQRLIVNSKRIQGNGNSAIQPNFQPIQREFRLGPLAQIHHLDVGNSELFVSGTFLVSP